MPWTPLQTRYLLSSGSPLTSTQRGKMLKELHADPELAHAKKGEHSLQRLAGKKAKRGHS